MKKILALIICVLGLVAMNCFSLVANAATSSMPEYAYIKFYDFICDYYYDADKSDSGFKNLGSNLKTYTKAQLKNFSKSDRKLYKQCKKYTKKIQKNKYNDVLYKNRNFLPALLIASLDNNNKGMYGNAVIYLENILRINDDVKVFNSDQKEYIKFFLGITYRANGQYDKAIATISQINKKDYIPRCKSELSFCYWKLGNYNKALQYADDVIRTKKINELYKVTLDIKYSVLMDAKRKAEANKVAYELYSYSYPDKYTAAYRVAESSSDNNTKIKYYQQAKSYAQNSTVIAGINSIIADIDQKIIDNHSKAISGYYVKPNWDELTDNDLRVMNYEVYNSRFDEYHKDIQNCLKYKGNDLKACYANVIRKQEKISQKLWDDYREYQRQVAEAERLQQLQMINANISQQNYLIQQQTYEMTRPRTYNTTVMPVGNMYYMNTTRY